MKGKDVVKNPDANGRRTKPRPDLQTKKLKRLLAVLARSAKKEKDPRRNALLARDEGIFWAMADFGLSASEAAALDVDCFDAFRAGIHPEGGWGAVVVKIRGGRGPSGRFRVIPVKRFEAVESLSWCSAEVKPLLTKARGNYGAIFITTRGKRITATSIRKRFRRAARVAGLVDAGLTPDSLRRVFLAGASLRGMPELRRDLSGSIKMDYPVCKTPKFAAPEDHELWCPPEERIYLAYPESDSRTTCSLNKRSAKPSKS